MRARIFFIAATSSSHSIGLPKDREKILFLVPNLLWDYLDVYINDNLHVNHTPNLKTDVTSDGVGLMLRES